MSMLSRRQVVLAKIETTYGTDPTPSAASNSVRVQNVSLQFPARLAERQGISSSLDVPHKVYEGRHCTVSFDVEVKGNGTGTADTPPEFGALLQACGLAETTDATASAEYTEYATISAPSSQKSVTIWVYKDGTIYKVVGCRGTFQLKVATAQIPILSFSMTGKFSSFADITLATPTYVTNPPAKVVGLTPQFNSTTLNSPAEMSFDLGNEVTVPDDLTDSNGIGEVLITGRNVTATVNPLAQLKATKDWWADLENGTAAELTTGFIAAAALNTKWRCVAASAKLMGSPDLGDRSGLIEQALQFDCKESAAGQNDALKLRFGYAA